MKYGLRQSDLNLIMEAIHYFPEIKEVVLFGSRAKGNFTPGSDVDLAVKGKNVTDKTVTGLSLHLNEEMPLPYFFDVIHYEGIREPLLTEHINRVGCVLFISES